MQYEFEPLIAIDAKAKTMIRGVMSQEDDADELGLVVSISGIDGSAFTYNLAMMRLADASPDDHVIDYGDLSVIVPDADLNNLRGATIKASSNLLQPGLVLDNPNGPSPTIFGDQESVELDGSVTERANQVVEKMINPAIAAHGGRAEVAGVQDGVAYIRFGGGCQGCGMAAVTLSQGIEATLVEMVPEITKVIDATDHADGANPYYEAAKK